MELKDYKIDASSGCIDFSFAKNGAIHRAAISPRHPSGLDEIAEHLPAALVKFIKQTWDSPAIVKAVAAIMKKEEEEAKALRAEEELREKARVKEEADKVAAEKRRQQEFQEAVAAEVKKLMKGEKL